MPVRDQRKLIIHLAYSLALKYNERIVPKFEDIAIKLRLSSTHFTPDVLK